MDPTPQAPRGRVDCSCGAVLLAASDPSLADRVDEVIPHGCGCHPGTLGGTATLSAGAGVLERSPGGDSATVVVGEPPPPETPIG